METILQKLRTDYPLLPVAALEELSSLIGSIAPQDEKKQNEILKSSQGLINLLLNSLSANDANIAELELIKSQNVDVEKFKQELSIALKAKEIPDFFIKNVVVLDPVKNDIATAAESLSIAYKACVQECNNRQLDNSIRPVLAQNPKSELGDVERFMKSRKNGGPAAGKFKVEEPK